MNILRIEQALIEIKRNTKALAWLEEYGIDLRSDAVKVEFRGPAGSCAGYDEAMGMIAAFARHNIVMLVQTSIQNCRNTIELSRAAIAEEASADRAIAAEGE